MAGGTRLNPCEKRLVNLRDRANMITTEHTTCERLCWNCSTVRFTNKLMKIPVVIWIISVHHLFPICWFFVAVCFTFPVKYNTLFIEWKYYPQLIYFYHIVKASNDQSICWNDILLMLVPRLWIHCSTIVLLSWINERAAVATFMMIFMPRHNLRKLGVCQYMLILINIIEQIFYSLDIFFVHIDSTDKNCAVPDKGQYSMTTVKRMRIPIVSCLKFAFPQCKCTNVQFLPSFWINLNSR